MEALCVLLGCLGGSLMKVDLPDFSAVLAPYTGWIGAPCVLVGMIGTVVDLIQRKPQPIDPTPTL